MVGLGWAALRKRVIGKTGVPHVLMGWGLPTTPQHLGSGQRSPRPLPGSRGSGLVLGQWGYALGPAQLVLEVVVSEGQRVRRWDDVLGASRVSCVNTAMCTAHVPVTTAACRAASFSPGVWWGGSAFGACAPHGRATWRAGSPAGACPDPWKHQAGWPRAQRRRQSHRRLSLLFRLEYLQQKQSRATSELEKQILEKQAREAEKEVQDIK